MANKKTSQYDALPGGIVNDTWLFDIAQATVKNFKGTGLEVKDYVNAGKAGGKTIEGGTLTTQTLSLFNNSADSLGVIVNVDGSLSVNATNYETLVTDDDDIPNKKYVDDAVGTVDTWNEVMHLGNTFTVLDTENLSAIITQNDTTNNPAALVIVNATAGNDITLPNGYIKNGNMVLSGGNLTLGAGNNTFDVIATGTKTNLEAGSTVTKVQFNDNANSIDFEIKGESGSLIFADSSQNNVGIGSASPDPAFQLYVLGGFYTGGDIGGTGTPINKGWFADLNMNGDLTFASGTFGLPTGTTVNEIVTTVDASSTDDQLATAKAVHDSATAVIAKRDNLTVSTPGQTAFTLSQDPSGSDSFGLFVNGNLVKDTDYSFIGTALTYSGIALKTTDRLLGWYDWQAPSAGILPQEQIYYWGDAGSDTNDGKTMPTAFKTLTKALSEAVTQTPSGSNQFLLYGIGAMIETGDHTIPSWITVHAPGIQMTGEWTFQDDSSANIKKAIPATGKISCKKSAGAGAATINILEEADVSATNGHLMQCTSGTLIVNVNGKTTIGNGNLDHETTATAILNIDGDVIRTAAGSVVYKSASTGDHHISYKRLISSGVAGNVFYTAPVTTGHNLYLDIGYSLVANNNSIFLDLTETNVFGKVGYTRMTGATSKFFDLQANSTTNITIDGITETSTSTADATSEPAYINLLDPNGHIEYKNDAGQHVFTGLGNSGYAYFGGISSSGYIGQKFKNHSGTMPAAGSNLVVTAATLGLSDARQIAEVYLTVKGTDDLWVKDGNNLLGITHKFDVSIPGAGHVSVGNLIITAHTGATSIGGQPFELSYKYQYGNYLN